ncbi:MAG: restriction endonuclease subunit S [Bacteroidaceae bacterium]|nr:restriction endonuclease subunit S [Bacteroidaceae bacterium]
MVEWKKLVSIADVLYGYPFESSLFSEDSKYIPLIRIRDVKPGKASTYYSGEVIEDYLIKKGDILVGMDGEFNLGKWDDRDGLLNQRVLKLKGKDGCSINGYLFHYMGPVFKRIEQTTAGGSVKHLSAKIIKDIEIPLPSLCEQERIVGILDTFTSSIENLKAQISLRRKQYEHYRNKLLDLEGKPGVEMKTLGEVFEMRGGYTPSTSNNQFWEGGTIPWFKMDDIRERGRILNDSNLHITPPAVKGKGLFKANSIILATSATIGEHALITVEHLSNQRFTNLYPKKEYLGKIDMIFFYYYMFIVDKWCKQNILQGSFASVDGVGLKNLSIPLPSLEEQSRIVSILDEFEASIKNLEAQLEAREKQYEYYRNKLLTFE